MSCPRHADFVVQLPRIALRSIYGPRPISARKPNLEDTDYMLTRQMGWRYYFSDPVEELSVARGLHVLSAYMCLTTYPAPTEQSGILAQGFQGSRTFDK